MKWAIGPLYSLGEKNRGISGRYGDKVDLPYNTKFWDYYVNGKGWIRSDVGDIALQCVDKKGI